MKLSKLEEEGTKIQKVFKGATVQNPDTLQEIKDEIKAIKDILTEIRQKLDEKS